LEGVRSPVPKEIEVRGSDFADNAHLPDGLGYHILKLPAACCGVNPIYALSRLSNYIIPFTFSDLYDIFC